MKRTFGISLALLVALAFASPASAATTYATEQSGEYNLFQPGTNGDGGVVTATFEAATALVINDVIQMVKVPKNVKVVDVVLVVDDLDTGTTIVLDVGYGGDPNYFIDGATTGQAGGVARMAAATAHPLALSANDTIDVLVETAPTGGGTGTISLTVFYTGNP